MNTIAGNKEFFELSQAERAAILDLLADEDPAVFPLLRDYLLAYGAPVRKWLEPLVPHPNRLLENRIRSLLHQISITEADIGFLKFCQAPGRHFDLEKGAWLLAATEYPELNEEAYRAQLDLFAETAREEITPCKTGVQTLSRLNHYLFTHLEFRGNETDFYNPDNSYLNQVIDRRTGNPISLCTVYYLVSHRLGLPVAGIGMPQHFLCRYQSPREEYYIDAFHRGKLFKKQDCIRFLQRTVHGYKEKYLSPTTPRSVLLRMCSNLYLIYLNNGERRGAARLKRYITVLS